MTFKLTKKNYLQPRPDIIILVGDTNSGPFDRNAVLPHTNTVARDWIMRCLLGEVTADDPSLELDEGADKDEYCWEYLMWRVPRDMIDFAEFYHKLKLKGIKIPERTED